MNEAPGLRRPCVRDVGLFAVWLLAFVSVVSWRQGVLYSGGSDPVVILKAAVAVAAAVGAAVLWSTAPVRRVLTPMPVLLVFAIVGVSVLGALQAGDLAANLVLAVRITLLAVTVVLVMASTSTRLAITMMLTAMAAIGVFAAATSAVAVVLGSGSAPRGRLGGGIPPLEPNELATLVLPAAIGVLYLIVRYGLRPRPVVGLVVLAAIIYATGSRTALAVLALGGFVLVIRERRLTFGVGLLALVGVVVSYIVVGFSSAVSDLALRGQGADRLLTLNSRTISWSAVLQTPSDEWAWWIGNGLSMKSIAVLGQAWKSQVFDSSWISSIAQAGMIGTAILAIYALGTFIAAWRRLPLGSLGLALVVTILVRSFFENGLIDSSATFAVFFAVALASWPGTRELRRRRSSRAGARPPAEVRTLTVPAWTDAAPAPRL